MNSFFSLDTIWSSWDAVEAPARRETSCSLFHPLLLPAVQPLMRSTFTITTGKLLPVFTRCKISKKKARKKDIFAVTRSASTAECATVSCCPSEAFPWSWAGVLSAFSPRLTNRKPAAELRLHLYDLAAQHRSTNNAVCAPSSLWCLLYFPLFCLARVVFYESRKLCCFYCFDATSSSSISLILILQPW